MIYLLGASLLVDVMPSSYHRFLISYFSWLNKFHGLFSSQGLDSNLHVFRVQIQLPPYLSNTKSVTSSLTSLQNQQQHQQWLWAAQLTAPRKPEEFAAAASHVPNWQNSRQEFSHMQYGQLIHPAALEVLGPRYIPVPTQQQHLMSSTSLFPQSRVQRYNHQLSTKHG